MTQFPHDEFAKNFLDSLLSPLGTVEVSQQISSEVRCLPYTRTQYG
jgi:hypothetical protein